MSIFSCPACLRRAINNLALEHQSAASPFLPSARLQERRVTGLRHPTRHHATYDSLVTGHHRRTFRRTLAKGTLPAPNVRRKGAGSLTRGEIKDALARENNRKRLLHKQDAASSSALTVDEKRQNARLKRDVEQYYTDPLQLANAVTAKLRVPDFRAAIALVRASEGIVAENVVSWNHCIDWCMSQGDTQTAWKLYNEMKKRGHHPDSYTYMIMLRGFSQNARKVDSAQRALTVYNSMSAPNSRVAPGTIHTNAVLNVCARAGDMASMWAISGGLPEKGAGKPDRWTYTTILNAIRENATATVADLLKDPRKVVEEYGKEKGSGSDMDDVVKSVFDEALSDGRKLWTEVSHQWRRAGLVLDEHIVCAMGRLILGCGTRKDFDQIFDLVDSTMNIKLAERGHRSGANTDGEHVQDQDQEYLDSKPARELDRNQSHTAIRPNNSQITSATTEQPYMPILERRQRSSRIMSSGEESTLLKTTGPNSLPLSTEQVYATPSNNTLSMILKAALAIRDVKLGKAYWHYLTTSNGPFRIVPDAENIISYLRLLRVSRASKDVLDVLSRDWPAETSEKLYRRGTVVIAMSTCLRDKNNPNVFNTADQILTLMQNKLEEVQLGMYRGGKLGENDRSLTFKERKALAKERVAAIDDVTFGEDEAMSELQRTKSGVESSLVGPKVLRMYMELAMLKTPGWNEGLAGRNESRETFERNPGKNLATRALRRLLPETVNVMRLAKMKITEAEMSKRPGAAKRKDNYSRSAQSQTSDRAGTRVAENLEDMVDLLRTIVSAHDRVISIDERFEELGLPRLDQSLVKTYRDQKRRYSGFLTRTKDEVQAVTRGSLKYADWRNREEQEELDKDEGEVDEDDGEDDSGRRQRGRRFGSGRASSPKTEMPTIGREVRRIYRDTDRSLGRVEQRSRRQKLERKNGVDQRLRRRLGVGDDVGMVDADLSVRSTQEVMRRMRERAFAIGTGREDRDTVGETVAAA